MMAVITISREFGSEGDTIAEKVAQALGYHLVDKAVIGSLLSQYGLVEFEKDYDVLPGFRERFSGQKEQRRDQMVSMLNQIVPSGGAARQRGDRGPQWVCHPPGLCRCSQRADPDAAGLSGSTA